jgi:hypothetical protein
LKDLNAPLKTSRMNHSMILTTEADKGSVLVVGGEDGNGTILSSCEILKRSDSTGWKSFPSLNNSGKSVGLCKFIEDSSKGAGKIYIYALTRNAIERIDLGKHPLPNKWEELNVKMTESLPLSTNCL